MLPGGRRMTEYEDHIDVSRMVRERSQKAVAAMKKNSVSALVLKKTRNVRYSTGAIAQAADATHESYIPTIAIVPGDGSPSHICTAYPEGVLPSIPRDHVHRLLRVEFEAGAAQLTNLVREVLGAAFSGKIGVDKWTWATYKSLHDAFPKAQFVDANMVLDQARVVKTNDEIEALRIAQQLNDAAMYRLYEEFKPGVTETELVGRFNRLMVELGAPVQHIDPFFCSVPMDIPNTQQPRFRELTRNRMFEEGEFVLTDAGVMYMGYVSDMGTTWFCANHRTPTPKQKDLYKRWKEVIDGALESCKPGKRSQDMLATALKNWPKGSPPPWPKGLYLAHGMGLEGVEPPYVGTDLGVDIENEWVFQPNVPMALEPYVYQEGVGGFRHELLVYITETGYKVYSEWPFGPLVD